MLLVLTNSSDATADYLCGRLQDSPVPFVRFDSDTDLGGVAVSYELSQPSLNLISRTYHPDQFEHVWFRRPRPLRPAMRGNRAESQHAAEEWSEALEGFLAHIPMERWMNHPARNVLASHKIEQITRARAHGLLVPETIVTQDPDGLRAFWHTCQGEVIVKPLACGYLERDSGLGDSVIYTSRVTDAQLAHLQSLRNCPTLFQRMVHKELDVRICVIDDQMYAVGLHRLEEDGEQRLDIRRSNMADVAYVAVVVPEQVRLAVLALVRSYGLRFSAIDMAVSRDGSWVFFEVNPNGQWAWLDLAAGTDIGGAFIRAFSQAPRCQR
jgi:glutathione synthase/RimK-type ligase-like ATP-grasp enzyme